MAGFEEDIRAEQIKSASGGYARFTDIDGVGQKTAEKLQGLRGVDAPRDIEGESAETLADRAGISERRAAKAIRGGGGNAQVRSREARKRAERPPNYFTQIDELSREQADEFGDFFGQPRTAANFRAEDVASMTGVDRQTAETVVLGSGGDPDELSDRRQSMSESAFDPDERGVPLRRYDFPGLDDTELATEPKNEYTPESREYVRGFVLDSAPQLIGPESERTPRPGENGGGDDDSGAGGFVDDRARQDTLVDLSAEAQASRDRETRTDTGASDTFADDRSNRGSGTDAGEQAGLFEQTEEMEGQAALGGGTATRTESEGFFDTGDGDGDPFGFDEHGPSSREPVPDAERQELEQFGGRDKRSLPGTGLAPSDPEFSDRNERQSRRDRNDPPDDLGEQLAAQRAIPSLVRPSATPAVQRTSGNSSEGGGGDTGGGSAPPTGALETALDTFSSETPNKSSDLRRSVDPADLGSRVSGDPTPLLQTATDRRVARGAVRGREEFRQVVSDAGGEDRVEEIESAFVEFTQDEFGGDAPGTGADSGTRQTISPITQPSATPAVGLIGGGRPTSDGTVEIDDPTAAEAGQLVTQLGERGIIDADVDSETLSQARETFERADGSAQLTDEEAAAVSGVVESAGSLSPTQRPAGLDVLEAALPADAAGDGRQASTNGQDDRSRSSGETTREFEFGARNFAQDAREDIPDAALTGKYDGRHKTIEVDTSQLTDRQVERIESEAVQSFADEHEESPGMAGLSDAERRNLRRSHDTFNWQDHGFEAMRAKAALRERGVPGTEWMDYYNPGEDWTSSISKLEKGKQRAAAGRGQTAIEGMRHDSPDEGVTRGEIARTVDQASGELKSHAIEKAREGDEGAISFLIDDLGMDGQRARGFVEDTKSDQERVEMVKTVVARVEANGRFTNPPPQDAPRSPGKRGRSSGQYVGDEVITPADPGAPIRRNPETGQYYVAEDDRSRPPTGTVTETSVQRGDPRR